MRKRRVRRSLGLDLVQLDSAWRFTNPGIDEDHAIGAADRLSQFRRELVAGNHLDRSEARPSIEFRQGLPREAIVAAQGVAAPNDENLGHLVTPPSVEDLAVGGHELNL